MKQPMEFQTPIPLSVLQPGERARIIDIHTLGPVRRRLLEMGFLRGEILQVVKHAPMGDPFELLLKGYHLSLRREESACLYVQREA